MATRATTTTTAAKKTATTAAAKRKPAPGAAAAPAQKNVAPAAKKTKAAKPAAAPRAPAAEAAKADKAPKLKLVRDSFTMPRSDIALIDTLKSRAVNFKRPAKKSELLRAGLHALAAMGDQQLKGALDALEPLRPGRPKKND